MYTTQTAVTGYLQRNLTEREATIITTVIGAVGQFIDEYTGQSWESSAAGTARHFNGNGEPILFIDPIVTIDSVEHVSYDGTVQTTYDSSNYIAKPLNTETKSRLELLGYTDDVTFDTTSGQYRWPRTGMIKITGTWGEQAGIPADIRLAATILAARWLNHEQNVKSENIEGYSRTFFEQQVADPEVMQLISGKQRIRL